MYLSTSGTCSSLFYALQFLVFSDTFKLSISKYVFYYETSAVVCVDVL